VVLAVIGTAALMAYVNNARDNAADESRQISVLVVTTAIPQGANLTIIRASTEATDVPERLVAPGALTSLDGLQPTLVAGTSLVRGEQLLQSRLVDPESLIRVDIPTGLQEITLSLAPERAVGGALRPGDTVGVILSFDPFRTTGSASADPAATTTTLLSQTSTTHLTLQQVLVTSVQYSVQDSERRTETQSSTDTAPPATVNEAPSQVLLVTLAVNAAQAEQITFAAEFGYIWLTHQTTSTDPNGARIVTIDQAYVTVPE
jgi:pilus assembly protein CpaB